MLSMKCKHINIIGIIIVCENLECHRIAEKMAKKSWPSSASRDFTDSNGGGNSCVWVSVGGRWQSPQTGGCRWLSKWGGSKALGHAWRRRETKRVRVGKGKKWEVSLANERKREKWDDLPFLKELGINSPIFPPFWTDYHILLSLKKFHPWNLDYKH